MSTDKPRSVKLVIRPMVVVQATVVATATVFVMKIAAYVVTPHVKKLAAKLEENTN